MKPIFLFFFTTLILWIPISTEASHELIIKGALSENRTPLHLNETVGTNIHLIRVMRSSDIEGVKAELEDMPEVEYVEYNHKRVLTQNKIAISYSKTPQLLQLGSIWSLLPYQNSQPIIAVLDSGLVNNHEDLNYDNIMMGYNTLTGTTDIRDDNGHGTAVTGIIHATYANDLGIDGIMGPFVRNILPIKITNYRGSSSVFDTIKGIEYAIEKGANIINLSYGGNQFSLLENEAIQKAIDHNILVVAAAGNSAQTENLPQYPASYSRVLSIGATNDNNIHSVFSNYNEFVDAATLGEKIVTTTQDGAYNSVTGTSFATPIVTGLIGIIQALLPNLSWQEYQTLLLQSASNYDDKVHNPYYGYGYLQPLHLAQQLAITLFSSDNLAKANIKQPISLPVKFVESNHKFTVNFSENIMQEVADSFSLFLNNREYLDVIITQTAPNQLEIAPKNKAWSQGTYFLMVEDSIKAESGKQLVSPYLFIFTVK